MRKVISGFAFHCHHVTLVEFVTDYWERVDYIKREKLPSEVKLRLKLFKMIPVDRLPYGLEKVSAAYNKASAAREKASAACEEAWVAYEEACAAYNKASAARNKAWVAREKASAACLKAWAARDKACAAYISYFDELHRELCPDCPWDGKTIFPVRSK